MSKREIYLDHAATTPLRKEVLKAMLPYLTTLFGNPNSLYARGRKARQAVEQAREQISRAVGCTPKEFIFTTSATEADYLALAGHVKSDDHVARVLVSAVEHKGVSAIARELKNEGWEIGIIPVLKNGLLDLEVLRKMLDQNTALVSVTMADSETGTLQPIKEIAKIIKSANPETIFHSDASQAAAYAEVNVKKLGVDLLTISAHKLGGPKGAAGLFVREGISLRRPHAGTPDVPAIVGFGAAMELNEKNKKGGALKVKKLRDQLENGIKKLIPKVLVNSHPSKRLPNFSNISFLDVEGEAILLYLDELGIMASTGSACDAENLKPSAVLTALGNPYEFVHGSIRFTLGHETKESDIKYVLKVLPEVIKKLRQISPLNLRVK